MAKKKTLQRLALRNNRPVPVRLKGRFSLNDEQHVGAFLRQHPAVVEALNALPPLGGRSNRRRRCTPLMLEQSQF
jgi:hypothetical protein